jgi:hypothetical protein
LRGPNEQDKNAIGAIKETLSKNDRDVLSLLNYAVYQTAVFMLDDLLRAAPEGVHDGPMQLDGLLGKQEACEVFIENVRRKMDPGSCRRSVFENLMNHAERAAESQLEQTPQEERPIGVDPLALRKQAIGYLQCARAIAFLQQQKKEAEENLLHQRPDLLNRYQLRQSN